VTASHITEEHKACYTSYIVNSIYCWMKGVSPM